LILFNKSYPVQFSSAAAAAADNPCPCNWLPAICHSKLKISAVAYQQCVQWQSQVAGLGSRAGWSTPKWVFVRRAAAAGLIPLGHYHKHDSGWVIGEGIGRGLSVGHVMAVVTLRLSNSTNLGNAGPAACSNVRSILYRYTSCRQRSQTAAGKRCSQAV
jgi:hypothetical protein